MRRYHLLLAGASWVAEYGDPDNPTTGSSSQEYSPYHNISAERAYPPVLFMTSTRDDRVHPGHARKMTAALDAAGPPVHYYENIEGGHGGAADNAQSAFRSGADLRVPAPHAQLDPVTPGVAAFQPHYLRAASLAVIGSDELIGDPMEKTSRHGPRRRLRSNKGTKKRTHVVHSAVVDATELYSDRSGRERAESRTARSTARSVAATTRQPVTDPRDSEQSAQPGPGVSAPASTSSITSSTASCSPTSSISSSNAARFVKIYP